MQAVRSWGMLTQPPPGIEDSLMPNPHAASDSYFLSMLFVNIWSPPWWWHINLTPTLPDTLRYRDRLPQARKPGRR
jgi:hypothetical protein